MGAGKDIYALLHIFFNEFQHYLGLDLHVFGESYGGHYVPAVAKVIHDGNKVASENGLPQLKLKSAGIGNGLVDPLVQ
jgi:cathepsin A (carboxypeptidase C)